MSSSAIGTWLKFAVCCLKNPGLMTKMMYFEKNKEVKSALETKTVCRDFIKIIFLSNGDREAGKLTAMLKSLHLLFSLAGL